MRRVEPPKDALWRGRAAGPTLRAPRPRTRFRPDPGVLRSPRMGPPRDRARDPRALRSGGPGARLSVGRAPRDSPGRALLSGAGIRRARPHRAPAGRGRHHRLRSDAQRPGVAVEAVAARFVHEGGRLTTTPR